MAAHQFYLIKIYTFSKGAALPQTLKTNTTLELWVSHPDLQTQLLLQPRNRKQVFSGEDENFFIPSQFRSDPAHPPLQVTAAECGRAKANTRLSPQFVPQLTAPCPFQKGAPNTAQHPKGALQITQLPKFPQPMCLTSSQPEESAQVRKAHPSWFHFCSCIRPYAFWHLQPRIWTETLIRSNW